MKNSLALWITLLFITAGSSVIGCGGGGGGSNEDSADSMVGVWAPKDEGVNPRQVFRVASDGELWVDTRGGKSSHFGKVSRLHGTAKIAPDSQDVAKTKNLKINRFDLVLGADKKTMQLIIDIEDNGKPEKESIDLVRLNEKELKARWENEAEATAKNGAFLQQLRGSWKLVKKELDQPNMTTRRAKWTEAGPDLLDSPGSRKSGQEMKPMYNMNEIEIQENGQRANLRVRGQLRSGEIYEKQCSMSVEAQTQSMFAPVLVDSPFAYGWSFKVVSVSADELVILHESFTTEIAGTPVPKEEQRGTVVMTYRRK